MKKTIFILVIIFTSYYSFAATTRINTTIDTNLKLIKGSITLTSPKKETVTIKLYNNMQLLSDDERVVYNRDKNEYTVQLGTFTPVILSYIKHIENNIDTVNDDFISIYSSIIPYISNVYDAEIYMTMPDSFQGLLSQFKTYRKDNNTSNTLVFIYNKLPKSIYFVASNNYIIKKITQKDTDIYAILFKEHENISYTLLQKSAYYIEMYENLFSVKFPYNNFIVVEDINPYGHALSSMAVFGSTIIDKDFIVERSLGHEILHQWLGAAIECNMTDGNFLEAITTYFSDYFYEKDNRISYRKDILTKYMAYSNKAPFPLKDFRYNAGKKEQSIGYGKGLMVLNMAKNKVGEDTFMTGIRNFIKNKLHSSASWKDLLEYIGTDDDFYNYWINNKNNITLMVNNINVENNRLSFDLIRKGGENEVPVSFTHSNNNHTETGIFKTVKGVNKVVYNLTSDNDTFVIDDRYNLMRELSQNEIAPSFDYLFSAEEILFAGKLEDEKVFAKIFPNIKSRVHIIKLGLNNLKDKNAIISMDSVVPQSVTNLLQNKLNFTFDMGNTTYKVVKNPYSNGDKFIMFSFNHTTNSLYKLLHYGSYSYIAFNNNNVVAKETDITINGIKIIGK